MSSSGVIAMLLPSAAEIYLVHLRGTGSGVVAASSKFSGILGAGFGVLGVFSHFTVPALLIAAPMAVAALMLVKRGIETRARGLEDIQERWMRARHAVLDARSTSKANIASKCEVFAPRIGLLSANLAT